MLHDGMFWATFGMTWVFGCVVVLIIIWHLRSKRRAEQQKLILIEGELEEISSALGQLRARIEEL